MTGLNVPGSEVWLSPNQNPKAKLDWRWEMVRVKDRLVGVSTSHPNGIVAEAIEAGHVSELKVVQQGVDTHKLCQWKVSTYTIQVIFMR